MTLAAAVVAAYTAILGPWNLTIPIEGLTVRDGSELQRRLDDQFAKGKHDERLVTRVEAGDGVATITVDCPGTLRLADIEKALEGSRFALRPETWELFGRVGFEWTSAKPLDDAEVAALRKDLSSVADVVELMDLDPKEGAAHHLHLRFASGAKAVRATDLAEVLRAHGIVGATLLWERWPHMPWYDECGARRSPPPAKLKAA